ncbi:hypothetical protein AN220_00720 [Streptomyces nanshensis]|nr:hypothetical protein AN220_00720 [Streptomyces nanshensis]
MFESVTDIPDEFAVNSLSPVALRAFADAYLSREADPESAEWFADNSERDNIDDLVTFIWSAVNYFGDSDSEYAIESDTWSVRSVRSFVSECAEFFFEYGEGFDPDESEEYAARYVACRNGEFAIYEVEDDYLGAVPGVMEAVKDYGPIEPETGKSWQ